MQRDAVADDLEEILSLILYSETWKTPERPEAKGTIRKIKSWDDAVQLKSLDKSGNADNKASVLIPYSVLVIEQKRLVQREIVKILTKIEHGDAKPSGGMGGGFGGGMF